MITYRDYQEFAINSIFQYFEEGGQGHPIVAMPTGTGKSVVIGGFVKEALRRFPGSRIIKLTHVKELIEQNFEKLLALWPTAPAGICSAGLNRKDVSYPITFAGIATVVKLAKEFGHIDLLLIDECHLVSPNANTMYRTFIDALLEINPYLKVIGFTATKYRLGQGMLVEEGGIFTDVCCDMTTMEGFNWFVSEGYLCPLIPKRTAMALETDDVRVQGGEFVLKQLQECVDKAEITYTALQEAQSLAYDRKHWLIFASGIEHTEHIAGMLDSLNISATFIHSKIPKAQRDARIHAFRNGEVQAMVNNGILTTGFDYPDIDLIIMLRPTQSPGLWVQMLGRGTRPSYADGFDLSTTEGRLAAIQNSEKQNCLVLDFARNTKRLGPINDPVLPRRKGKGGGSAPVRICEECGTYCHASLRVCPHCGVEFPMSVKFGVHAGEEELIAKDEPQVEEFKVDKVVYSEHRKQDKPPTIKVSYYCGLRMFNEWICLEHEGYPRKKSRDWWRERAQDDFPPETTAEALGLIKDLKTPISIRVWINKKYPEILSYAY